MYQPEKLFSKIAFQFQIYLFLGLYFQSIVPLNLATTLSILLCPKR